ncbi:MAG: hypothetical protein NT167_21500, partial [Verrucomicrobia bacterium]|nr:hypothetical protein [Verrucomicrobiota bacterium]
IAGGKASPLVEMRHSLVKTRHLAPTSASGDVAKSPEARRVRVTQLDRLLPVQPKLSRLSSTFQRSLKPRGSGVVLRRANRRI